MHAKRAEQKEMQAQKIAVIADTTLMKEYVSDALQPAVQQAYRLRPLILKVFAEQYDKHADCMPHGIVPVVDIVLRFLCG